MSDAVENVTSATLFIPTLASKTPLYITYIATGTILMCLNLAFLAVIIYRWRLAKKWPLIFGMFAANVSNGLHGFVYGIYELINSNNGVLDEPFSGWTCMLTLIPSMWIMGITLPATFQLLIGIERVTAIVAFQWFSVHWNSKKLWIATAISYSCTVVAFVVPGWWIVFKSHFMTTKECWIPYVVDYYVLSFVIWYSISACVVGIVLTIVALVVGRARLAKSSELLSKTHRKFSKQVRLTKQLTAVAILDLVLVTIPNFLSTFPMLHLPIPAEFDSYNPVLTSIYCCINMCVYIGTNRDFRLMVLQIFKTVADSVFRSGGASRVSNAHTRS